MYDICFSDQKNFFFFFSKNYGVLGKNWTCIFVLSCNECNCGAERGQTADDWSL